jgi:hypothetical protein
MKEAEEKGKRKTKCLKAKWNWIQQTAGQFCITQTKRVNSCRTSEVCVSSLRAM